MTAGIPEGVEIGLFSDEACTTPVDVETIKAGDKIYIKYPEHIPGEYVTFYEVYEGQVSHEQKVPLTAVKNIWKI